VASEFHAERDVDESSARSHATCSKLGRAKMKHASSTIVLCAAIAAMSLSVTPASARGMMKGAAKGAVVGHVLGHHAKAGAVIGAVHGHHRAARRAH
jgi:hypothetical protein